MDKWHPRKVTTPSTEPTKAELREIIERRLEDKARELCTGSRWDALQGDVLEHRVDPWSAADEMLKGIGG